MAVAIVLVFVLLVTGALLDSADDLVTVFAAAVAVVALVGWWQDKLARAQRDREEAARREQEEHDREQRDRERHDEHMREMKARARLERAHTAERQWARELREQVSRLHRELGTLAQTGDVRELVLETAVKLVEAERGLLLSRRDMDGDGDFDMVCQTGFENDATHSAVAQEYAGKVLERDKTVREDDSTNLRGEGRNPADDEIHNLLAIPIFIQDDFEGVVLCANREGGFDDLDDDVLLALGDHAGAVLENGRLQGELRSSYMAVVRMLAEAIEAKDPATLLHSEDVAEYVRGVAEGLGLEPRRREELLIASLLHDVGKIGVSERILLKPGALTPDERAAIELHPKIGYRLISQVPALEGIGPAVLHHHERWDGDGYPDGLRGDEIPLDARVICVADSFSAMTSARPYREPMTTDEACQELQRCAGEQFDPQVVELFVEQVCMHPPEDREAARRAGERAGRSRGTGPAGARRAGGGLRAQRRRGQPDAAVRPPPPARAGRADGRGVGARQRALLGGAGGAGDAGRDQRDARATPPATGPSCRRPRPCPTWPRRCTAWRAVTAAAGWPSWCRPRPARWPPPWAATWSARWSPRACPCAPRPPSGAPATRRPLRWPGPGRLWARPRSKHPPPRASYRRGRCAAPSHSGCCCSGSTPPPSAWTPSATPSTRATSRTTCWPPSRSSTTTTST